jgi:hypothetical protein
MVIDNSLIPQVVTGVIVSVCSISVTWIAQAAAKKLGNVATKEFVVETLKDHEERMLVNVSNMFVKSSLQNVVNSDIEARMRRVESDFGIKIQAFVRDGIVEALRLDNGEK